MKYIKYYLPSCQNIGTEDSPEFVVNPGLEASLPYSETGAKIAEQDSWNGEYEIIEDDTPDPNDIPTQLDLIEAQITYTAMMTNTLLEA